MAGDAPPIRVQEELVFAGVPVLVSRPETVRLGTRLIVLYHGFGPPQNPAALARAVPLESLDAVLAYVNLPMVAGRFPSGGIDELRRIQQEDFVNGFFFRSITQATEELEPIIMALAAKYPAEAERGIGLFGFSAGGAAALLALWESSVPIKAIVVVNAPMSVAQNVENWERVLRRTFAWDERSRAAAARYDVRARARGVTANRLQPSILIVQGDADASFAPGPAREAAAALQAALVTGGQAKCEVIPGLPHQFGESADAADEKRIAHAQTIDRLATEWFSRALELPSAKDRRKE